MSTQTQNEAKHTPGPWVHNGGVAESRFCIETDHDIPNRKEIHLACVSKPCGMTSETYRANAHLIAAAPDLLAALISSSSVASGQIAALRACSKLGGLPCLPSHQPRCPAQ